MKTLIIYNSIHHKNTEKIARAIGKVLKAKISKPDKVDIPSLKKYDLLGFGSGIYFSIHHESLFQLIDKLPKVKNKKAFIFTSSGSWQIKYLNDFNAPLVQKLENKGYDIIGTFCCRGYDTVGPLKHIGGLNKGRPNKEDIRKAENFAENIKMVMKALLIG
ncbi:flavodoxin [Candidatus Gottesmanbacteria bacterium CG11_big_fil_rev_8_21_14_0_20_37_11]|uniref:Flavodoxin n=3 Tax=Candidatus Gottesmaniibacteriota TaxID=1752720 RepID=A0A2M7RR95_9BACT|nr:MAG: flavodoxin [Candidatus Gottesmanbacteria bacterium CG1_02_37_22]PIP32349.1 MAG: flavodoxin [Candidatus Gottesmanbacteria bacterium CG23_combo_of_CG06-09_8_20_14_all_37_19]PIR07819.1 MAG: flavodoxin [Candidatus Gottesmanbacteria bacterium CG11_big_fil_rev_8_21_14_0_20_37_11]PIZ02837.1 MAG: flavodoxin [Candidatus Gottesmanbacteria bacterium CG_4_10_14_0_8_um_filter_37_24]